MFDVRQLSIFKRGNGEQRAGDSVSSDKEALAKIDRYYSMDSREILKYSFEKQWFISIAFLMGYQNLTWNDYVGALREPKTPSYRMRIIQNKIRPFVWRFISAMTQSRLLWRVVPNSSDKDDVDAARVADCVLEHYASTLNLDELRQEAELWAACAGTCFLRTTFDPDGGTSERIWIDPETKKPIPDEILRVFPEQKKTLIDQNSFIEIKHGSPEIAVVNPFRIFLDPWAAKFQDMQWILETSDKPLSYFFERYPEKAEKIRPGSNNTKLNYFERRLLNLNGVFGISGSIQLNEAEESAEEQVLFLRPYYDTETKRKYPQGRMIVAAGGQILINRENPYYKCGFSEINQHGFPYVPFFHSRVPGRFWASSLVEDLLPSQRLYNYVFSKIAEGFRMMGSKKWTSPREAHLGLRSITSGMEVMEYDATSSNGMRPEQVQPVGPAPEYMDILGRCEANMAQMSAQPDVMQGEAPGSMRSGVAIQALQEKAMLMMNPLIRQREVAWGNVGQMLLKLVGHYVTEPTLIKIYGKDRQLQVKKFTGADLRGNFDARIPIGSMKPESKASAYESVMALTNAQILDPINNPADRRAIFRTIRFAEDEEFFREYEADRYGARRENDMMTNPAVPQFPPINDFDDDQVHLHEHNLVRKSDVYLVNLKPMAKIGFDQHCKMHEQRIQARQQQAIEMQMQIKGSPGATGSPGRPNREASAEIEG